MPSTVGSRYQFETEDGEHFRQPVHTDGFGVALQDRVGWLGDAQALGDFALGQARLLGQGPEQCEQLFGCTQGIDARTASRMGARSAGMDVWRRPGSVSSSRQQPLRSTCLGKADTLEGQKTGACAFRPPHENWQRLGADAGGSRPPSRRPAARLHHGLGQARAEHVRRQALIGASEPIPMTFIELAIRWPAHSQQAPGHVTAAIG